MAKFITELAFDFFYVMNEGMDPDSDGWKRTGAVLLMLVELGQLTRAICMEQLGWSELSETVMSYSDVVWIFTDLAQRVLPRSLFFYIALFLVVTLFGTTAYAVRLLKTSATVSKLHVKAWRWFYFVSSVLLFPSVIQWIMFPLECFVYSDVEGSMSVSADGECLPWASPQKIASIISLLLVALHILFTLAATLLLFEIHPLSRNPWAQSTGRVELIWAAFKVAVVMCSYLNVHVTSVVLSGFLLVLTTALAYMHFLLLPFNDQIANVMRGASFALLWWLSLSSVIAACYPASDAQKAAEESSMSGRETRQLILLGVSPVFFLAGLATVLRKQSKMLRYLHLLRGDKTAPGNTANPPRPGSDTVLSNTGGYAVRKTSKRRLSLADDGARSVGSFATARSEVPKTSQEKFFDVDSEISRAFKSGVKARTFARRLLYQRDIDDVSYLSAVVNRALRENPSSSDLLVFQLQLLSFIIGDTKTADSEIARLQSQGLDLDHTFLLYSVARRSANDAADASRPGTTVNTKLEEGMKAAHSSTLGAITHMSHFWKVLRKLNKKSELAGELPAATAEEMVRDLKLFEDTFVAAEGQFASLLDKFPGTRAILQEYALFKDVCANNEREAEKLRTQAAMLETGNGMGNEEMKEEEEHARSAATSDTEKSRSLMFKFVATWSATVLGAELKTAHAIHWRVQACVFLLVAVATVGFVLSDQILFNNMVKNDIKLIRETSLFRTYTITGNFLYRSQFLAGHHNQTDEILDAKEELLYEATVMREGHHAKFKKLRWYQRDDYTTPDHEMLVPQAGRFEFRHEYVDYWTMGGDLARRLERMASMDEEEILKGGYTNESLQGNLAGIFLMENTYREIVPTIEEIMQMYEDMVTQFGHLATTVVTVNVILASVLNVAIALSVLYAVVDSVRILQHRYICCCLALSLPTDTVKKLHRFYSDQATGIRQMEDEEAEKRAIEQGGDVIEAADPDMDQDEWDLGGGVRGGGDDYFAMKLAQSPTMQARAQEGWAQAVPEMEGPDAGVGDAEAEGAERRERSSVSRASVSESKPVELSGADENFSPAAFVFCSGTTPFLSAELLERHRTLLEEQQQKMNSPAPLKVWAETGVYSSSQKGTHEGTHFFHNSPRHPRSATESPMAIGQEEEGREKPEEEENEEDDEDEDVGTLPGHSLSISDHNGEEEEEEEYGALRIPKVGHQGEGAALRMRALGGEEEEDMMGLQDEERAAGVLTMAEVVLMKDVNERELERQRNGKGKKGSFASASSEGKRRGRKGSVNSDGKGERGEGVPVIGACFGMEGEDSVEEVGVGTGAKIVQRHGRGRLALALVPPSGLDAVMMPGALEEAPAPTSANANSNSNTASASALSGLAGLGASRRGAGLTPRESASPELRAEVMLPVTHADKDALISELLAERVAATRAGGGGRDGGDLALLSRLSSAGNDTAEDSGGGGGATPIMMLQRGASPLNKGRASPLTGVLRGGATSPKLKPQAARQSRKITFGKLQTALDDTLGLNADHAGSTELAAREGGEAMGGSEAEGGVGGLRGREPPRVLNLKAVLAGERAQGRGEVVEESVAAPVVAIQEEVQLAREEAGKVEVEVEEEEEKEQRKRSNGGGAAAEEEEDPVAWRSTLREVTLAQKQAIRTALRASQPWTSSPWVYSLMFAGMLALCILSIIYPARFISRLVNLGPTTNAAGRRKYLSRACSHLARELVLDDGFSHMTRAELHGALHWHLEELKRVSAAVRLGDDEMGINEGADFRNAEHNAIMYQNICPWREDDSDCSIPGLPDVEVNGLYSLILSFYEAVEAVMAQYGVELGDAEEAYQRYLERTEDPRKFPNVHINEERYKVLYEDPHLKLILQSFDGDLFEGFETLVGAFDHEIDHALHTVHVELRLLFAIYLITVVVLFYGILFRRTHKSTLAEVDETRAFMFRVPCHTLEKTEVEQMRLFFANSAFSLPRGHAMGCHRWGAHRPAAESKPEKGLGDETRIKASLYFSNEHE